MRNTLSVWAAALVESCWLAALVAVPVYYNVYSQQTFEPDKVVLLRSLSAILLAAAIVWCVQEGRDAWTIAGRPVWRLPLVQAAAAWSATYLLATVCSVAPQLSLWGSYLRAQGAYTWVSYITVFLAIILVARERARWQRLVSAALLASVPAAIYPIMQRLNVDPIDWGQRLSPRATGTAGNAIFLGAYLLMVLPLTAARLLAPPSRRTPVAAAAPYAVLMVLQGLGLLCSLSRGPTVGFAAAALTFVALAAGVRAVRWPVLVSSAVAGLAIVAALVTVPGGPRRGNAIARLTQIGNWQEGSTELRTLTWGAVTQMLRAAPTRTIVGHGPETFLLAFAPVYPAQLASIERPDVAPDRAHNTIMDALATVGVLGSVAELAFFVAFFFQTLRWLGMVNTAARRKWFLSALAAGGIAGVLAPIVLGQVAFVGIGVSLGLAAAVLGYVTVVALQRSARTAQVADADAILLAALFAAVFGHFVELQTGIGTSTTLLYLFAFSGLAVAIGAHASSAAADDPRATVEHPGVTGALVALLFVVLTADWYTPTASLGPHAVPIALVFLATWVFGAVLASAGLPRWEPRRLGAFLGVSAGLWLLFVGAFAARVESIRLQTTRVTPVGELGTQLADTILLVAVAGLGCMAVLTVFLARTSRGTGGRGARWPAMATAALLMGGALVVGRANLQLSQADCWAKLGDMYEEQGAWSDAIAAHERALHATARQEYAVNLSRALIAEARVVAPRDPGQRDRDAARAVELLEEEARANPLNPDLPSNLARVYGKWARIGDPAQRTQRLERADAAYNQALSLWPNNVVLWNELAILRLERGQVQQMEEAFDHSLHLNADFAETYVRRALVFVALRRFADADANYRRARQWTPDKRPSAEHLAHLYRDTGQVDRALAEAQVALANASGGERLFLQNLIRQLEAQPKPPPARG